MKFPKHIQGFLAGFSASAYFEQRQDQADAEWEQQQLEAKRMRAEKLRPFVGRLLLVTDNGPFMQDAHNRRITQAIVASGMYDKSTPIGFSANIMLRRLDECQRWQQQTAIDLAESLKNSGLNVLPRMDVHFDSHESDWLERIASAPGNTVERTGATPADIGHIAVVSPMDMHAVGVNVFLEHLLHSNGMTYRLADIDESSQLNWQLLSADSTPSSDV